MLRISVLLIALSAAPAAAEFKTKEDCLSELSIYTATARMSESEVEDYEAAVGNIPQDAREDFLGAIAALKQIEALHIQVRDHLLRVCAAY